MEANCQTRRKPSTNKDYNDDVYGRGGIQVKGEPKVHVKFNQLHYELPVVIVDGQTRSLLGRNWLHEVKLNSEEMFSMNATGIASELVQKYAKVFQSGLGTS